MRDKKSYRLEIITPAKTVLDEEVTFSVIKSGAGPVGIMPEHAPLLGTVETGVLTYRDLEKAEHRLDVGPGFLMVSNDGVSIVASSAKAIS